MTYQLRFDQKPGYLHAVVTGKNSRESVLRYVEEVGRECAARGCVRVLIEERLEGPRLGTTDIFRIATQGSQRARGALEALAFVDVNAESRSMDFAETVAVNRGVPVRVFSTVDDAVSWLLADRAEGASPRVSADVYEPRR